jgi:hypothetical protein
MPENKKRTIGWQVNKSPPSIPDRPSLWLTKMTAGDQHVIAGADFIQLLADQGIAAKQERQSQQQRIKNMLPKAFPPDGRVPSHFTLQAIQRELLPLFAEAGWKEPSTDSIARALGRRKAPR